MVWLSYPYMTSGKTIALTIQNFVSKVICLNILSKFVIAFLPRSKHLLISWLQSPSTVIMEPKKIRSVTAFHISPIYLPWSDEIKCHELWFFFWNFVFWMLSFKPAFWLSSFTLIKKLFSSSSLSAIGVTSSAYLRLFIFLQAIFTQLVLNPAWHFAWCSLDIS